MWISFIAPGLSIHIRNPKRVFLPVRSFPILSWTGTPLAAQSDILPCNGITQDEGERSLHIMRLFYCPCSALPNILWHQNWWSKNWGTIITFRTWELHKQASKLGIMWSKWNLTSIPLCPEATLLQDCQASKFRKMHLLRLLQNYYYYQSRHSKCPWQCLHGMKWGNANLNLSVLVHKSSQRQGLVEVAFSCQDSYWIN